MKARIAVCGGGHNGGGLGVVDDGIVIDLAGMAEVVVDPAIFSSSTPRTAVVLGRGVRNKRPRRRFAAEGIPMR
jgi:hypothetical protein